MALKRRVAVVGLGSIGRRHARLLNERDDTEIWLVEPDPEVLALARRETGATVSHPSLDAALEAGPEAVVVATPHHLHAEQTLAALRAGCHVLCEKPMAPDLAEAERFLAAAGRFDRVLTFGFHLHFHPGLGRLKAIMDGGELGEILHVSCHVGTYVTLRNSVSRYQARQEGALMLDYVHQPDLLYWFLGGAPRRVQVEGFVGGRCKLSSRPNVLSVVLGFERPLGAIIHLNYVQAPERHHYEVVGDRGWATLDFNGGCLTVGLADGETVRRETFDTERDPVYRSEHQAFWDAVDGRRPPESPAAAAIVSMRVKEAVFDAWKTGGPVTVRAA